MKKRLPDIRPVTSEPELASNPTRLASTRGWAEEVYVDFIALQNGEMSKDKFRKKYLRTRAILDLDMTGFTIGTLNEGQIDTLLRIFDIQKIAIPVLEDNGAGLVRAFADDLVALFDNAHQAFDAAMEIHERVAAFNKNGQYPVPTECCIGIGFGQVYAIGPNLAQGIEMNLAAKLGEDIARGGETLLTQQAYDALSHLEEVGFERQLHDELDVPFYRVVRA
ncbi:MAG: hypothetical protein HKN06_10870 [Gammaproteobacteria bacterium]|nr:hypothetical protein [Gammaproteobacteria bacterium]